MKKYLLYVLTFTVLTSYPTIGITNVDSGIANILIGEAIELAGRAKRTLEQRGRPAQSSAEKSVGKPSEKHEKDEEKDEDED